MAGKRNKFVLTVKDMAFIAVFSAILFVQEEALTFLPNIQLTIFLILLYSKKLGFLRTSIIVVIHVLLDNLVMGSFSLVYTPAMFIGWMLIPIIVCLLFKKTENPLILAFVAFVCGFLYCWCYILPNYLFYNIDPWTYLVSDVVFELILASCGFLTVLLLYKPCSRLFDKFELTRTSH